MRDFFLTLSSALALAACGSASGAPGSSKDAGHEEAAPSPKDAGEDASDAVELFDSTTGCESVGAIWGAMDREPIVLADPLNQGHRTVAGIDIDGAAGKGITLDVIGAALCPGTRAGKGPGGTLVEAWGVSREFRAAYDPGSFFVEVVSVFPGYLGMMTLPTDPAGPDAGHTFKVGLGAMELDGEPFFIDWTDHDFVAGNELYNALQYNSVDYSGYDATPCGETGACTIVKTSEARQWSIDQVGITMTFDLGGTVAIESSVVEIDLTP